ncbi:MAG TPA: hypothetical protein VFE32_16260 [Puia sp.]|jgi:hypothetical protein|nr:hypothetical protein [Puia sp.]
MKYLFPVLLSGILLVSCKKFIQNQEEKQVISDVTNGYWYVTGYEQNDSNITAAFSGYLFKFDANNTVTGIFNNTDSVTGEWLVNVNARTITSDFPAAGYPLNQLNETWYVTDSYTDSVSATSSDSVNHTSNILQLKKK